MPPACLPEILGDAAVLVDPQDIGAMAGAMLKLAGDEAFRNKMIALGREHVKRYTWEKAAKETIEVYETSLLISK